MSGPEFAGMMSGQSPEATPPADYVVDSAVPFEARQAMQRRIWERCLRPADNEWTTWTDAITLAETAAEALLLAGYEVRLIDGEA